MGIIYRVWQGLANLKATMTPEDLALADRHLSPAEQTLFRRMDRADQRHSVRVLRTLLAMGVEDESLLKAAILHDVGKSRCRIGVLHRTLAVLMRALFGGVPQSLTVRADGTCWLPLYVIANHPRIGACMLARAGTEERVWRLVELHQLEPDRVGQVPEGAWLRQGLELLRRADNES